MLTKTILITTLPLTLLGCELAASEQSESDVLDTAAGLDAQTGYEEPAGERQVSEFAIPFDRAGLLDSAGPDGPFSFQTTTQIPGTGAGTPADLDGDGVLDMVTLDADQALRWFRADGDGDFPERVTTWGPDMIDRILRELPVVCHGLSQPVLTWAPLLSAGDVDADGKDEIIAWLQFHVTSSGYTQSAVVTIDVEDDETATWEMVFLSEEDPDMRAEVLADLDGDGGAEILVQHKWGFHLKMSGPEQEIEELDTTIMMVNGVLRAWAYDLDGTGNLDIIAFINWNEDAIVAAFVSKEDGGFAEAWTARVERWGLAHANGSAYRPATDIVMATDQTLEWLTADGLTPAYTLTQMNTIGSIFGDFNGDGTLDIIGHSIQNRGEAAGLAGDGQGGFTPTDTQLNLEYGEQVRDLDQDGLDDIYRWLWAGGNTYDLDILRNTSVD